VKSESPVQTKQRLLTAASQLFAERGFHGSKMRDIARYADVNLAAGNYHYGSKKALYLEVLRAQFAEIRSELARHGATLPANGRAKLSRAEIVALLHVRAKTMLDLLIGTPPRLHGTLMQREMTDPSEALPVIVDELIAPMTHEIEAIVAQLAPEMGPQDLQRCAFSIVGQVVFYRFAMPAMLYMFGWSAYPANLPEDLAAHISEFTLGGLERLSARQRTPRTRRAARRTRLPQRVRGRR
jgi:TetR/AcrR family transcriptional regulator, regulator of cefoperazone and chloramphenicol sensitivity